jgi:hypothetical protein
LFFKNPPWTRPNATSTRRISRSPALRRLLHDRAVCFQAPGHDRANRLARPAASEDADARLMIGESP